MLSLLLYGLLAVVVAVGLFALAARFLPAGEQIAPPLRDEPPWELPAGRSLDPQDVDSVRLPVALRGYRFAETDLLLDRLAGELRARDEEIARLRGRGPAPYAAAPGPVVEPAAGPRAGVAEQRDEAAPAEGPTPADPAAAPGEPAAPAAPDEPLPPADDHDR